MELSANSPHHLSRKKKVEFQLEALQVKRKKKRKNVRFRDIHGVFLFYIRLHFICTLDLFTLFFLSQTKMQV